MIIKMGQELNWGLFYKGEKKLVKAVKMQEDFMLETPLGFVQGKKGQWVVDVGDGMRFPCDEGVFLHSYVVAGDERRLADRRQS